jgi:hypothetical protein
MRENFIILKKSHDWVLSKVNTISHPPQYSLLLESRTRIMESYWCMKKNSITNRILYGIDFDPTLTPCPRSECDMWRDGECIHIRKVGRYSCLIDV